MLIKDLRGTESTQDACAKMRVWTESLVNQGSHRPAVSVTPTPPPPQSCGFSSRGPQSKWEKSRPLSCPSLTKVWSSSTPPTRYLTLPIGGNVWVAFYLWFFFWFVLPACWPFLTDVHVGSGVEHHRRARDPEHILCSPGPRGPVYICLHH